MKVQMKNENKKQTDNNQLILYFLCVVGFWCLSTVCNRALNGIQSKKRLTWKKPYKISYNLFMATYKRTYSSSMPTYNSSMRLLSWFINCPFLNSHVADGELNWESNSRFKMEGRNELIAHYFNLEYQQKEFFLLLIHNQNPSSRHFKPILARRV